MIPPVHHAIWPAYDPIPYTFRSNLETWQSQHPDWTHHLWTPAELDELPMRNRDLYDNAELHAPNDWIRWKADIARLEIAYQFGGVYADTDARAVADCSPLLEYDCWFAESPNAPGLATQAVFAAAPEHPFINLALNQLGESAHANQKHRINHRVGSRFIARLIQANGFDVDVLPWHWFAGQAIKERGKRRPVEPRFIDHGYFNSERHATRPQIAAFKAAAGLLDASGANWFLTSGLLLGHIREGRILPWDLDIDVGIFPEDVQAVRDVFRAEGWEFRRDFDSQMWPVHNQTKIDIHTHYRDGDEVYKLHGKRQRIRMAHPAHLFDLAPTIFYMQPTRMPNPPEAYLSHMYGDDWLTPKKEWKWDRDPRNITRI